MVQETGQEVAIGETVEVDGKKYTKVETSVVGEPKGTAYRGEDGISYKTEWVESNMTPKAAPAQATTAETGGKRVYKAEQIAKTLGGKVVGSATKKGAIPNDFDIYLENKIDWKDMRDKMEALGYKSVGSSPVVETKGKKFEGKDQRAFHFVDSKGQKVDVFQEETNEDFSKRMQEQSEVKTAPTETSKNLFDELESINQIKNAKDKQAAKKEFDKANGNKATKINTNFKTIFDSLSKNNLVKRRC